MKPSMVKDAVGLEAIRAGRLVVDAAAGTIWRASGKRAEMPLPTAYGAVSIGGIQVLAHRLVWMAANGPIPEGMFINHKNGKRWDNRIANLELATPAQNNAHAQKLRATMRRELLRGERGAVYGSGSVIFVTNTPRRRRRRA